MGQLTSTLAIKLLDDVSGPAGKAAGALNKLGASGKDLSKLAGVSPEMGKLVAQLERLQAMSGKITAFRDASRGLNQAGQSFRQARQEVTQLSAALEKARAKAAALEGVRTSGKNPTAKADREAAAREVAQLERQLRAASSRHDLAKGAFVDQGRAVRTLRSDLTAAGVSLRSLASAEASTKSSIDATTAALRKQGSALKKHEAEAREYERHAARHGAIGYAAGAAAGVVSAHGVATGIEDTIKAGARYQHETVSLQNAGRTPEEMHEIEEASRSATRVVPTASYEENLKVINETTGAFGTLHHAIENLPFMQKSNAVLHAAAGDKIQGGAGELGNKLARFFEERQVAGNTETFQREAEGLVRAMAFTRGNFNPEQALNFAQQSKSALPNFSERFLTKIAPSLITMMGGDRAGTAANAFNSVVTGKVNDKKQAEEWMRYGLLDKSMVTMKAGHAIGWRAGAVKGTDLALSDPLRWAEEVALPAMQAQGVNTDDRMELTKALATMFRNSNSNMWANSIMQGASRGRLHKDEDNINKAGTLDEIYQRNLKTDPTVAITALTTSLENLATAASSPAMSSAAGVITSISGALGSLADVAKDHPALAMAAGGGLAAGALGGAGYLSYQLMNGFGLGTAATALDGSAVALTEAAAALSGAGAGGKVAAGAAAAGGLGLTGGLVAGGLVAGAGVAAIATADQIPKLVKEKGLGALDPATGFGVEENPMGSLVRNAEEAKGKLDELNGVTVAPQVDGSAIDGVIAKVRQLLGLLNSVPGAASSASAAVGTGAASTGKVRGALSDNHSGN